jgi:hypothetical protein
MPNAGLDPYECDCGWLERAANDPSVPIGFDAQTNEYFLRAGTPGDAEAHHVIKFCPWCGGDAPVSHRTSLFEVVTPEETIRLHEFMSKSRTRDDVIREWGPPDEYIDNGYTETEPQRPDTPARTVTFDVMRYKKVSQSAVVDVILGGGDRVRYTYYPKVKQE